MRRNGGNVANRVVIGGYMLGALALTAGYYAYPQGHLILWSVIGASSAAAIVLGVRTHRPRRRLPWWLLAAGNLVFAAGGALYSGFHLVNGLLQIAGVVLLVRAMTGGRDRSSLVDSLIVTLGVGLLSWIFLIGPYAVAPDLSLLEKVVSVSCPLSDVLLLAVVFRLVGAARRSPAVVLLAAGCAGLLAADASYGVRQLGDSWRDGGPIDLGWLRFYPCWGLAALHPSMVRLTEPQVVREGEVSGRRLTVLALSAAIAPAVLLVETLRGAVRDGVVIAILSTLIFALVLTRLAGVVNRHRQALARERGLREAANALLLASDVAAVVAAGRTAVDDPPPAGAPPAGPFTRARGPPGTRVR